MTEDPPHRPTVEELYEEFPAEPPEGEPGSLLDESLNPRSQEMLFSIMSELGVNKDHTVLDAGCRDGRHVVKLAERFGCRTIGVDH